MLDLEDNHLMTKETEVGHPVKAQEDLLQKTSAIAATDLGIGLEIVLMANLQTSMTDGVVVGTLINVTIIIVMIEEEATEVVVVAI